MITLNQVLAKAKKGKYAIGHFNASTFEQIKAIVGAADATKTPVMIGTSEGEAKYLGLEKTVALVNAFRKDTKVPIFLNLDHGHSFEFCRKALEAGYDSIHFDGSHLSYEDNREIAKKVADLARKKKSVSVEAELGALPTESSRVYSERIKIDPATFTDPDQAAEFIKFTGVDRIAPAFGTLHGIQAGGQNPHIDLERLAAIIKAVRAKAFIVMHGASGTPMEDIREAIRLGVANVHINTEIRAVYLSSMRAELSKVEYAPYKILDPVVMKLQKFIESKIKSFKR